MSRLLWLPVFLFVAFCVVVAQRIARQVGAIQAQLAAYRLGDYEGQLKLLEGYSAADAEKAPYFFFKGIACFELGRLVEAERAARRGMKLETGAREITICRDQLGRVLMEQERWYEAEECFRECIEAAPERGGGHRALAELLLRRGERHYEALESAQLAVAADRAHIPAMGKLAQEDHALNLGESLAVLAWAVARSEPDATVVESALQEAFTLVGEGAAKPIRTELEFCAGQAYELLGNAAESRRHFQAAAEIDPAGNYGRLALMHLGAPLRPRA